MSFRNSHLSANHYAAHWPVSTVGTLNDRQQVNELAIQYATMKDSPEREQALYTLLKCFHSYCCKYLSMISQGHLPSLRTPAGKEASKMLSTLVARGRKPTRENLLATCRTLHLAFKQNTADDIYDILVLCLIRAIRKYDPYYTTKVKQICEVIDARFRRRKSGVFTAEEVTQLIGYDSLGYIRLLVKRKNLESVAGPKKKVIGYRRGKNWPPDKAFLSAGPVGFVYFLPMYFRWYLHEYISNAMSQIETDEGMLQLDHRHSAQTDDEVGHMLGIPHAEGAFVSADGSAWAADISMMHHQVDVSQMTLDWVDSTSDRLFRNLTSAERYLLYLVYVKDLNWVEVAGALECDIQTARKQFDQVMLYLRGHVQAAPLPSSSPSPAIPYSG